MCPCDVIILAINKLDWLHEKVGYLPPPIHDVHDLLFEALQDDACDSWPVQEFAERIIEVDWPYNITE